jgi:hypothetical protein
MHTPDTFAVPGSGGRFSSNERDRDWKDCKADTKVPNWKKRFRNARRECYLAVADTSQAFAAARAESVSIWESCSGIEHVSARNARALIERALRFQTVSDEHEEQWVEDQSKGMREAADTPPR